MTEATKTRIPLHLRKYIVEQNYSRYTSEDQAVWRYCMRQLKDFLSRHAHQSYLGGLVKTGISVDRIPEINKIDEKLEEFGWGAVPVSGFIPPAAFMEFQALGILPIASDMRSLDHLLYTPAPDIVHEAAGHAPILADPEYAAYLRQYGEVARHTILSKEDLDQYEAIRVLSDIKEDPRSTAEDIAAAEKRLTEVNGRLSSISEAALLSRMNWWTAEYGLIGELEEPRIFGAGLLSSVGESSNCLQDKVKKIRLSVDCVNYAYDITEQQPQLFVAKDFSHLSEVLEDLAARLSYRRGGVFGLERAIEARTVNTVQLNSGLQISGQLKHFIASSEASHVPVYLQFEGPCQLSLSYRQMPDQGTKRHPQGFSSPLGLLRNHRRCLSTYQIEDLRNLALNLNQKARLQFESGVMVEGVLRDWVYHGDKLVLLTWADCRVTLDQQVLFDPSWGEYDMAVGSEVTSVFGGPADRENFGETDDFVAKRVPARSFSKEERDRHGLYQDIRSLRESNSPDPSQWSLLKDRFLSHREFPWLAGLELIEISYGLRLNDSERLPLEQRLLEMADEGKPIQQCIHDGLRIARQSS